MKKQWIALAGSVLGIWCASIQAQETMSTELVSKITIEEVPTPQHIINQVYANQASRESQIKKPLVDDDGDVGIGDIINLGKEIWDVIKENRPVVESNHAYANAIPSNVKSSELHGFSDIKFKSYRFAAWNLASLRVYEMVFTLTHQFGGQFKGKGRYLETVSVVPTYVYALWGQNLNLNVSNVSVSNVGTEVEQIGSATMEIIFKHNNVFQHEELSYLFQFRGDTENVLRISSGK